MYMQLLTTVAFQQPPDGKIILIQSNQENSKHQKYFRNVNVIQEKSQSGMKNSPQVATVIAYLLVCGFVASSGVLVIGHNTINIPEKFQKFTVLSHCLSSILREPHFTS